MHDFRCFSSHIILNVLQRTFYNPIIKKPHTIFKVINMKSVFKKQLFLSERWRSNLKVKMTNGPWQSCQEHRSMTSKTLKENFPAEQSCRLEISLWELQRPHCKQRCPKNKERASKWARMARTDGGWHKLAYQRPHQAAGLLCNGSPAQDPAVTRGPTPPSWAGILLRHL